MASRYFQGSFVGVRSEGAKFQQEWGVGTLVCGAWEPSACSPWSCHPKPGLQASVNQPRPE